MKQLVIAACLINLGDDRGGVDHAPGDFVDVPKDVGEKLARAERTLYIDRKDDPTKSGQLTATKEMLNAVRQLAEAKAKEAEKKAAPPAEAKAKEAEKKAAPPAA